ncbi:MAG: hypothetical protein JWN32_3636 [Solirubrobacterales bacterium]|nr:hypothetical protein [Solirubrobacterales bacterium]
MIQELKARIARGGYVIDARAIAEVIVERVLAGETAAVGHVRELSPTGAAAPRRLYKTC